ncbi:MAG TPA: hypothetical protein VMG41_16085 [Gemmatimonadales bacterium]|nr:hypothetical protein [Gemmatimonadales bacterium]
MNQRRHSNRILTLTLALAMAASAGAAAQSEDSLQVGRSPTLVKYGKWITLAAAVGMGLKAASTHNAADRAYSQLTTYCDVDATRCNLGPTGRYLDPVSEGYYQAALAGDRRARGWLVGGELALIGTAGMFVWELTRPSGPPRNIPFEPTLTVGPVSTQFGILAHF